MRKKRILIVPILVVLLALLTTTAFATSTSRPGSPTIVGTWMMTIPKTATSPETNETMQTFFADGNYIETNNNSQAGSTGHGLWVGSNKTYQYTFQVFTSDAQGNYTGKRIVHGTIHMADGNHFTGKGSADVVDAAGKVTKNVFSATFEGTRMEMQVP
jgi:hypothetical protein